MSSSESDSSDTSSLDQPPSDRVADIDILIHKLSRSLSKLHEAVRLQVEPKLLIAKMKREKLRALIAVARTRYISSEMEILVAANALRMELGNLIEESRNIFTEMINDQVNRNKQLKDKKNDFHHEPKEKHAITSEMRDYLSSKLSLRNHKRDSTNLAENVSQDAAYSPKAKRRRSLSPVSNHSKGMKETKDDQKNISVEDDHESMNINTISLISENKSDTSQTNLNTNNHSATSDDNLNFLTNNDKNSNKMDNPNSEAGIKENNANKNACEENVNVNIHADTTDIPAKEQDIIIDTTQEKLNKNVNIDTQTEAVINDFDTNKGKMANQIRDKTTSNNQIIVSLKTHNLPIPCLEKVNLKKSVANTLRQLETHDVSTNTANRNIDNIENLNVDAENEFDAIEENVSINSDTENNIKETKKDIKHKVSDSTTKASYTSKDFDKENDAKINDNYDFEDVANSKNTHKLENHNTKIESKSDKINPNHDFITNEGPKNINKSHEHQNNNIASHKSTKECFCNATRTENDNGNESPCSFHQNLKVDIRKGRNRLSTVKERRFLADSRYDKDKIRSPRSPITITRSPILSIRSTLQSPRSPTPLKSPKTRRNYNENLEIHDKRKAEELNSLYEEVMSKKQIKTENDNQSISSAKTLVLK